MRHESDALAQSYGVRALFRHHRLHAVPTGHVYEERVVALQADSEEQAFSTAEANAKQYAAALGETEYLEFLQLFQMFDSYSGPIIEVFSLMRESDLGPDAYIEKFFSTGAERQAV